MSEPFVSMDTVVKLRAAETLRSARDQYNLAVVHHLDDANRLMLAGHFEDAGRSLRWADWVRDRGLDETVVPHG
jgi:hypothetical protein